MPITIEVTKTPIMRQKAKIGPIILNTKTVLIIFIAGPAYKNVKAGPMPQPFFNMLVKRGIILHEQVGRIWPAIDAIGKENHLLDFGPRKRVIDWLGTKVAMAPARRNEGSTVVIAPHVNRQHLNMSTISMSFWLSMC